MKYEYMVCGVMIDGTSTNVSRHFVKQRAFERQKYLQNAYNRERLQISAQTFQMIETENGGIKFNRIFEVY